jgi:cyclase
MGELGDIDKVVKEGGADAVAMAHVLHYEKQTINSVREYCIENHIPVRQL